MGGVGGRRALPRALALLTVLALPRGGGAAMDECLEERSGRPQRCMPEFVNAAFNATVVATNTCGTPAEEYCVQTGVTGVTQSCHLCDASQPHLRHGASFLTDYNSQADSTWWQSQSMLAGVQHPAAVNLTLHLGTGRAGSGDGEEGWKEGSRAAGRRSRPQGCGCCVGRGSVVALVPSSSGFGDTCDGSRAVRGAMPVVVRVGLGARGFVEWAGLKRTAVLFQFQPLAVRGPKHPTRLPRATSRLDVLVLSFCSS